MKTPAGGLSRGGNELARSLLGWVPRHTLEADLLGGQIRGLEGQAEGDGFR